MSSKTREPENETGHVSVNDNRDTQEADSPDDGLIPAETKNIEDDIAAPLADKYDNAIAGVEDNRYGEQVDVPLDQRKETEEHTSRTSGRVVDKLRSTEETPDQINNAPRRVLSKLPSEKAGQDSYVERGHVAKMIKFFSPLDKDTHTGSGNDGAENYSQNRELLDTPANCVPLIVAINCVKATL